jgi:hypothetical protein
MLKISTKIAYLDVWQARMFLRLPSTGQIAHSLEFVILATVCVSSYPM